MTVAASAGAAQAQHRGGGYHGGGHYYGGGYRGGYYRGGGYGFGTGLVVGSTLGYGFANCERRVFIDRYGYRRVRRVCY